MYQDPSKVTSPKNRVKNVNVLFDTKSEEESWSVATLQWDGSPAVGIRWNGDKDSSKGTPQARGNPAWLVIPHALEEAVLKAVDEIKKSGQSALASGYKQMAADREREKEAEEWTEALLGEVD